MAILRQPYEQHVASSAVDRLNTPSSSSQGKATKPCTTCTLGRRLSGRQLGWSRKQRVAPKAFQYTISYDNSSLLERLASLLPRRNARRRMAWTPTLLSKQRCLKRSSILLRLSAPAELCAAELHPQGALLLAGAQSGDVLLFATSSGGLVQVGSEAHMPWAAAARASRSPAAIIRTAAANCYAVMLMVQRLADTKNGCTSAATCVTWAELGGAERVVAGHKSGSVRVWDVEHSTGRRGESSTMHQLLMRLI